MVIEHPCSSCRGTGRSQKRHTISISIPAGIEDGQQIVLSGQGNVGTGGIAAGDLFVLIEVSPHTYYRRKGSDLYCVVPISFSQAALGGSLSILNIQKKQIKITIPSGTQCNHIFRLRGEGVPILNRNSKGDLYVKVVIAVPKHLNAQVKKALVSFSDLTSSTNKADLLPVSEF